MLEDKIWDYTALDVFQTCRKKFYWWGIRNLQPKTKSPALLFGGNIHDALDIYYTDGLEKAIEHFRATHKDREDDELRTVANGVKMLEWYAKTYKHEPFKVLHKPETGFVFPLGNILVGGRVDLPVEWDGLWVMEHKTTSSIRSTFFRQFELDKQLTIYTIAAEEFFGRKCLGCIVNAMEPWKELKKPTAKSKTPEQHFVRAPITRTDFQKDRAKLNIQRIVRDIKWCAENDEWYEAEKKDICFYYNYDCPYKDLCQFGDDKAFIEREYIVEKWEPYKLEEANKDGESIVKKINPTAVS